MREAETVEEAIAKVRESVRGLTLLVIENFLTDQYKNRTRDLDAEDTGLESEWQILSESRSTLAPITEAKARVLQRLADDQIALGDLDGAERKQQEAREVQQNFDGVLERIDQVHLRRTAIVESKRTIAREIFEEIYPSIPAASFAVIECAVNILDGFRKGMFAYQTLTNWEPTSARDRGLVQRSHVERLTPNSFVGTFAGRQLAARVAEWFR